MASKRLRVVAPDEAPAKKAKPMAIAQAAEEGTRRDYLVSLRARLSTTLDNPDTSPRDLAALMRRAEQIDGEIRAIDAAMKEDGENDAVDTPDEELDAASL